MTKELHLLAAACLLSATSIFAQTQQITTTTAQTVEQPPTVVTESTEQAKSFTGTLVTVEPSLRTLSLSSKESDSPLRYNYGDETKFFDADGNALTPEALESGSVAELTYIQAGTSLVIVKGVFSKPVEPVVTQQMTAEQVVVQPKPAKVIVVQPTPATVMEESTSTTTVTSP